MTKLNQIERERAEVEWSQLKAKEWAVVTEEGDESGDDPLWKKANGFFTIFLAKTDRGWEFSLLGLNDDILVVQVLAATNFDDAVKECDELLLQYVTIGVSALSPDEVRITQITEYGGLLIGVGLDGKLYQYGGAWSPLSMKLIVP